MSDAREKESTLLRPDFTRALAARLQAGASINLTAPHGFGRRRTLQDVRSLLPPGMRVLYADMKCLAGDFHATLRELCSQARLGIPSAQGFDQLIDVLSGGQEATLIILHNFDLLHSSSHDPLFDTELLPHLDRIACHANIALLIVSEEIYPDWPLPCEPLSLPALDTDNP